MSTDFEQFKMKRITNLRNIYSLNCKKVVQYYNTLIYNVSRSSSLIKSQQIEKLMTAYKAQMLALTKNLDSDIKAIQSLVAPTIAKRTRDELWKWLQPKTDSAQTNAPDPTCV